MIDLKDTFSRNDGSLNAMGHMAAINQRKQQAELAEQLRSLMADSFVALERFEKIRPSH
jgi:hypothetical protein